MWFRRLFRRLLSSRPAHKRRYSPLAVERLEDRAVPSATLATATR